MKRTRSGKDTLIFIVLAALMMVAVDYFVFGGKEAVEEIKAQKEITTLPAPALTPPKTQPTPPPEPLEQESAAEIQQFWDEFLFDPYEDMGDTAIAPPPVIKEPIVEPAAGAIIPEAFELPAVPVEGKPKIAIIIDDVGMDLAHSNRVLDLPSGVTLAILPYAQRAAEFAKRAREDGHEVIIHTPMEAMNAPVSLGGMGLTTAMNEDEIIAMMDKIFASMDGYVGINNHMGSKMTSDPVAMARVMAKLKERGLFFVDSKTIASSVGSLVAYQTGVRSATRDVFLDHEETDAFVDKALAKVERVALEKGSAIAIGHPKEVTLRGLQAWLPTLEQKGFELVPVSTLLRDPAPVIMPASGRVSDGQSLLPSAPHSEPPLPY